jgi:hypothetical protein
MITFPTFQLCVIVNIINNIILLMSLVVLVSFIYIVFFSDDCKYFCIGTGIKYLFIYLLNAKLKNQYNFKLPKVCFLGLIFCKCYILRTSKITANALSDSRFQIH